ncbi:MAG: hypothetical protein ABIW80_15850 [Lapillicoccus sp.]
MTRKLFTLSGAVALIGGLTLAVASFSPGNAAPSAPPAPGANLGSAVSALNRGAAAADTLPAELMALPVAARFESAATPRARKVGESLGRTYWVVPGQRGEVCLVAASGSGETFESAGTCTDRSQLARGGIWFSETTASGDQQVSLLVPDSVTSVRSARGSASVSGNFAVVDVPSTGGAAALTVTDVSGAAYGLDLGNLTSPAGS